MNEKFRIPRNTSEIPKRILVYAPNVSRNLVFVPSRVVTAYILMCNNRVDPTVRNWLFFRPKPILAAHLILARSSTPRARTAFSLRCARRAQRLNYLSETRQPARIQSRQTDLIRFATRVVPVAGL